MLLELLVMLIEFTEFIRKNIGIRNKVKVLFTVSFLHPYNIEAKPILPGNLVTLRKMIDFLILVQSFVQVAFAARRAPKDVPLV